jgi:iron complex outermembrane recepter protein
MLSGGSALADPAATTEVVTVTAQKRSEDIKEVPLNISVLTGTELREQHITDITDLSREVPGLSFSNEGGTGLSKIELRGISSDAGSPTVGIYLDEVPITMRNLLNTGATEPQFFDLDRIEVLRGPQGTLYGASSLGGTIRFISKQPDLDDFGGNVYSELSGTKHGGLNYEESGVVNMPLVKGMSALRLGFDYLDNDGYINQLSPTGQVTNDAINDEKTGVLRATLKARLNDDLTITPAVFFQRLRVDDTSVYDLSLPALSTAKLVAERGRDTLFVPSITADYDLHWADLTSVSSYFWRQFNRVQDGTYYNSVLLANTLSGDPATVAAFPTVNPASIGNLPSPAYIYPTTRQYSEELRLASKSTQESGLPFTWIGGLYFSDQHVHLSDQEFITGVGAALQNLYGTSSVNIPVIADPLTNDLVYSNTDSYDERQYAVFGEVTYDPIETIHLTAGLRYNFARESLGGTGGGYYNADAAPQFGFNSRSYAATPKFAATWDVTDTSTLYANASKGFRLGAPNQPIPQFECAADFQNLGVTGAPDRYNSDSLWSYEAGNKARMLGNRLTVDAAVYYITWKNVQQHIYLPICGFDYTTNAGNAESYGTEVSVRARVTPELLLTGSASYTHSTLTQADPGLGASVGDKLLGTPDWTATFGAEYTHAVSDGVDGFFRADWEWTGASHGAFDNTDPDYGRPVYNVLNASIGADMGSMVVTLFVKNLLNQDKTIQRPSLLSVNEGYTVRPLTVGVSVSKDF